VANDKLLKAYLFWPPGTIFITKEVDCSAEEKGKRDDRIHVLLGEVGESTPRHYRRKFAAIPAFSGCQGSHDLRVSPAKPRFRWFTINVIQHAAAVLRVTLKAR